MIYKPNIKYTFCKKPFTIFTLTKYLNTAHTSTEMKQNLLHFVL